VFKNINNSLLIFGLILILLSSSYVSASSLSPKQNNLDEPLYADIRIIVNEIDHDNQTYILISIIIYNLVDRPLNINIIEYPSMEIYYNNVPVVRQTLIISNSSFYLSPHEIITLYNASILINRNITLEIFSGIYKVFKYGIYTDNVTSLIIGGNTVYIVYIDMLTIKTGSVIIVQSSTLNTNDSYISILVNDTDTVPEEINEEASHNESSLIGNFIEINETEESITNTGILRTPSLINNEAETSHILPSYTAYNSLENISQNLQENENHSDTTYDLVLAAITVIIILVLAKAITYVLRGKT